MSVYYCYQQVKQRNVTIIIISIFPQAVTDTVKQSAPQINLCRTVRPLMEIRYRWDVVADESGQHNMSNNSSQYGEDGDTCSNSPICPSIVILATCVSLVGIIANGAVLVIIFRTRRLHKPVFMGFAALALADFLYLIFNTFLVHLHWFFPDNKRSETAANVLSVIVVTSAFSSASHVTFLSVQQYFMIAHPLSSLAKQTNRTVFIASLTVWIVCTIPSSFYIYAVRISNDPVLGRLVNFSVTIIVTFLPIIIILICHFLKLKALGESVMNNRQSTRDRMSKVVSVVILTYLLTTLPINIHDTIKLAGKIELSTVYFIIYRIAFVLLHLNFTINPFIYFLFTPQCRRILMMVKCLPCYKRSEEIHSRQTGSTLLSHDHSAGRHDTNVCHTAI